MELHRATMGIFSHTILKMEICLTRQNSKTFLASFAFEACIAWATSVLKEAPFLHKVSLLQISNFPYSIYTSTVFKQQSRLKGCRQDHCGHTLPIPSKLQLLPNASVKSAIAFSPVQWVGNSSRMPNNLRISVSVQIWVVSSRAGEDHPLCGDWAANEAAAVLATMRPML
jgi:hypothetical protein